MRVKWTDFNSWLEFSESILQSCVHYDQVSVASSWLMGRMTKGKDHKAYTQSQLDSFNRILEYWTNKQVVTIDSGNADLVRKTMKSVMGP